MTQCTKPDDLSLIPKPNSARENQLLEAVFWPPLMVPTNTHTECNKYKTKPELCWMWWQTEGPTTGWRAVFWGVLLFYFTFSVWDRVSLWTYWLELRDLPASISYALGLKAYAVTPSRAFFFLSPEPYIYIRQALPLSGFPCSASLLSKYTPANGFHHSGSYREKVHPVVSSRQKGQATQGSGSIAGTRKVVIHSLS